MSERRAVIIGAGFGGLALGIRLQSLGFATTILERLDGPGGRAYTKQVDGFTFDMGPTVITAPHLIEELFALECGQPMLDTPDFPPEVLRPESRARSGNSGGPATSRYVTLQPILPFYRINFDDGTYFDYDGDPEHTREQIRALAPEDLAGYERFHEAARAIFERGFLELGYTYFDQPATMARIAPDLIKLDALRTLFSFVQRFFTNPKLQQVFSFEPLLIGGNPLRVPAIYAMIHFVEKTWGIHYARGGMGALVRGFARKFEDLGGVIRYDSAVTKIHVTDERGRLPATPLSAKYARGVTLRDGSFLPADLVVSNADYVHTYKDLIDPAYRAWQPDVRLKLARQSMSLVVIYFGFRADPRDARLRHHTIILGPRYEELLKDIFDRKILADDFSQYLHIPTLTDPSLAPPGHHAAYTLVPVPHLGGGQDWATLGEPFTQRVLTFLDERGYLPGLRERLVHTSFITPDYFAGTLHSWLGNGFGIEPILRQSALFRPHNRSEDIRGLYLVGANAQPGAGTPAVMMSAKMTARAIAQDFGLPLGGAVPAPPRLSATPAE